MRGRKLSSKELLAQLHNEPSVRRKVFKDLLDHLTIGYSIDCFADLSDMTIKEFTKKYPEEFIEEEIIRALRKGKGNWEDIGYQQARGTCLGNSRSWFYNMANRYNWSDKAQIETEHKGAVNVNIVNYSKPKPSTTQPE